MTQGRGIAVLVHVRRQLSHAFALSFAAPVVLAAASAAGQAPAPQPQAPAVQPQPPPQYPPQYVPYYPYPPPYGYPPPYAAPPPAAPRPERPVVIPDWDPDVPVPKGYQMIDGVNGRLIGAGIGLLSAGWLTSALVGGLAQADGGSSADDWTPLYFPVAGPFAAIATLDPKPAGLGLLLADGILQVGGALGIVVGILDTRYKLVRVSDSSVRFTPIIGQGFQGLSCRAEL